MNTCDYKDCDAPWIGNGPRCYRHQSSGKKRPIAFHPGSLAATMSAAELRDFQNWLDDHGRDAKVLESQLERQR